MWAERLSRVTHTTVINWVKQSDELLPDADDTERVPEVAELDELQTCDGAKTPSLELDSHRPLLARSPRVDNR